MTPSGSAPDVTSKTARAHYLMRTVCFASLPMHAHLHATKGRQHISADKGGAVRWFEWGSKYVGTQALSLPAKRLGICG